MKRHNFDSLFVAFALLLPLASCYTEPNPLSSVATVGGPIALIRTFTVLNSATNTQASTLTAAAGTALTLTLTYTTLDAPVTAVNLYTQAGSTRTRIANVSVNVTPSPNRATQTFTYTIPAGTAANTRIIFIASAVTAGGESFSGNGISGAGTVVITTR